MGKKKAKKKASRVKEQKKGMSTASKIALTVISASFVVGVATVIGLDQIVRRIFVNDVWPDEEWSSDDWADEDLDL